MRAGLDPIRVSWNFLLVDLDPFTMNNVIMSTSQKVHNLYQDFVMHQGRQVPSGCVVELFNNPVSILRVPPWV